MSAKAELHLFDKTFTILYFNSGMHTLTDYRGKSWGTPDGGLISIVIPCPQKPSEFLDAMLHDQMVRGKIVFWKWDGIHVDATLDFANAHIINRETVFYNEGNRHNYTMRVVISPGIQRYRDAIFEKSWNPSNPFAESTTPVMMREEKKPTFLGYHFETLDGDIIAQQDINDGDEIYLVIESEDATNEETQINLDDKSLDYEYQGKPIKNDILTGIIIQGDISKYKLKAVKQQNKA